MVTSSPSSPDRPHFPARLRVTSCAIPSGSRGPWSPIMTDLDRRIPAVVAELRTLARSGATPAEARTRITAVGGPGVALVHEREARGDGYQFDVIIDEPDGALALRYCPD